MSFGINSFLFESAALKFNYWVVENNGALEPYSDKAAAVHARGVKSTTPPATVSANFIAVRKVDAADEMPVAALHTLSKVEFVQLWAQIFHHKKLFGDI